MLVKNNLITARFINSVCCCIRVLGKCEAEIVTQYNDNIRQQVAQCDFFAELDEDALARLMELGIPLRLRKGETLFREGDVLDAIMCNCPAAFNAVPKMGVASALFFCSASLAMY